jgi:predicted flap endonuclease-1-like 5' DNA nuclease
MAKTIYDQSQNLYSREAEFKHQKATIDTLNSTIDSYQHRLRIIEEELEQVKVKETKPRKSSTPSAVSANYEHVSKLLGKQVTDNDLTLIIGIGPKTAALLQSQGLQTWEELAAVTQEHLRKILSEAGGIYKTQDPTHWAKQALMASQGEWRKLRVFQETLRKVE